MHERVRLTDVSPRDGLQNEPGVVPAAEKARLISMLARAGLDEIEAASFVSPKWIPQLADAQEVLSLVARDPGVTGRLGDGLALSALVPNDAGYSRLERANEAIGAAGGPARLISKVAVFTAASETFSRRNTNAGIDESIARFEAFTARAIADGLAVRAYISCAVACPFEGPIAPAAVRRVADRLLGLAPAGRVGAIELDLGDTIGAASPADIGALLGAFSPDERSRLTLHLHDTFGRAADCAGAALGLGVRSFDGSAGGLGGCPYAGTPERRAPGNIDTRALVRVVRGAGFGCAVNDGALAGAGAFAQAIAAGARLRAADAPATRATGA